MNRCDRKFTSSPERETPSDLGVHEKPASGARPKSRQQQAPPKAVDGRPWAMSNSRRNGEGKFPRATAAIVVPNATCHSRESKSGAFDSLLKRANRRRSNASTSPGDKAPSKQAVRDNDACVRQEDVEEGNDNSEGADGNSSRGGTARDAPLSESHESSAPTAEYTILARPDRHNVEAEAFAASQLRRGSEKESASSSPVIEVPSKESRAGPNVQSVGSYSDDTSPYGPFSPPEDSVFVFPPRPNGYQHPVMLSPPPSARSPSGCGIDELSFLKLAEAMQPCFPYHEMLPYPPCFPPLPSPPSPAVMAAFGPANLQFPHGAGYFVGRVAGSRRRTKSFPRRLPERRLYDSHGRWVGQDARRPYQQDLPLDLADFVLTQDQMACKNGPLTYDSGGRESAREQRGETPPRRYGRRHYSASWSHPAVLDDDIEDLLPLIDKLAIEYSSSESSAEGSLEAQIPDEGAWFSVLPENTQPEDRFIWSPRRDLHRPKSIWSPLKPRLGYGPEDNNLDPYTRIKYRCRTYTETTNTLQRAIGAFAEGRRSVSCELPYYDDNAARGSVTTRGAGWSPWSSQLPTADLLKAPTL